MEMSFLISTRSRNWRRSAYLPATPGCPESGSGTRCSSRLQSYGLASRNVLTTFGSGERPTPSRGTPSTSGRDSSLAALRRTWSFSSRSSSSNWASAGRRLDLGTVSSVGWPSCSSHTSPFSTMLGASARSTGTCRSWPPIAHFLARAPNLFGCRAACVCCSTARHGSRPSAEA